MRKFALLGYPLSHSFSKSYFTGKFSEENIRDCIYVNFELPKIEMLSDLLDKEGQLIGFNVTIPYKEKILDFLDEIDQEAKEIGAVNAVKISNINGVKKLKGFNTDVYGFEKPLLNVLKPNNTKALILGTGGASKAVSWVMKKNNISFSFVSRTPKNKGDFSYEDLSAEIIKAHTIIINTSPVGTFPNVDDSPAIPYEGITSDHILYDLVYNPEETLFLKKGAQKKAITLNGLPMLYLQAEKAWEIWNS